MSRTCPECSTQYADEILHCPEDGKRLVLDVAPAAASAPKPAPPVRVDELIGCTVGSYQVTRLLGEGGMGSVYLGEHPVIGSRVAIKFLHPRFSSDKKIVDRFFNEARAVNLIGHDNILKILDLNVTADNRHYFVMEYLHGKSLQDLMAPDVPVPLETTGPILLQFCEALQAAHDKKIYHRDIKPDNVYLIIHKGRKNFVKVVDFGIAKLTDKSGGISTGQTQTGMVMGTPAYMSPEQAGGMGERIGPTSDVYSTGVMMYQLATGRLPFPGTSFGEVLIGHLQLTPPAPRELNPALSADYERVIMRALEKQQSQRQQSMRELQEEIRAVMESLSISPELPRAEKSDLPTVPPTPGQSLFTRTPSPGAREQSTASGRPTVPSSNAPAQPQPQRAATAQGLTRPSVAAGRTQGLTMQMGEAPPPASRLPLFLAASVAILALVGGAVGYGVWHSTGESARRSQEESERAVEKARRASQESALRQRAQAEQAEAQRPVLLSVVSEPLGAEVIATWPAGSATGKTDFLIEVPRGATVTFQFSHEGWVPFERDVIANQAQTVSATLTRLPPARPAVARHRPAVERFDGGPDDALPISDDIFQ